MAKSKPHSRAAYDPHLGRVEPVVHAMKAFGLSLHYEVRNGQGRWFLNNGQAIRPDVAVGVAADPRITDVGDSLFAGVIPSQTYRYNGD